MDRCRQGTQADFKNELLYKEFGINYSQLPAQFRKVRDTPSVWTCTWMCSNYRRDLTGALA